MYRYAGISESSTRSRYSLVIRSSILLFIHRDFGLESAIELIDDLENKGVVHKFFYVV